MDKPEALRLADELEDMTCLWSPSVNRARVDKAAAELRRLHAENERLQTRYEACDKALRQWLDKTAWIQETGRGCELGMHRADAVRQRLSAVEAQRDALLEALKPMIDLAEFWINHRQERYMSEQEYRVWIALGHESNAMIKARAAIKAVEEGK